jgi:hypothetical protein
VPELRRFGREHFAACHFPLQRPIDGAVSSGPESAAAALPVSS